MAEERSRKEMIMVERGFLETSTNYITSFEVGKIVAEENERVLSGVIETSVAIALHSLFRNFTKTRSVQKKGVILCKHVTSC